MFWACRWEYNPLSDDVKVVTPNYISSRPKILAALNTAESTALVLAKCLNAASYGTTPAIPHLPNTFPPLKQLIMRQNACRRKALYTVNCLLHECLIVHVCNIGLANRTQCTCVYIYIHKKHLQATHFFKIIILEKLQGSDNSITANIGRAASPSGKLEYN